jgi:hypothetical protein
LDYDAQKRFVVTTKEFYDAWKQLLLQHRKLLLWNMIGSNCCCNQKNFCFRIWCSKEIAVATKKTSALEYGVQKKLLLQPSKLLLWNMVFRRNCCCNQVNFWFKKTFALEYDALLPR